MKIINKTTKKDVTREVLVKINKSLNAKPEEQTFITFEVQVARIRIDMAKNGKPKDENISTIS